jgi:effector-binding domain-containing protein
MLSTPQITTATPHMAAVIPLTSSLADLPKVMGPAFGELMAALGAQGIAPAARFFSHYLKMGGGVFEFEVGVPISMPVAPTGRVKPGELPGGRVARTIYQGPYEGLHGAWGEFGAWIKTQGLTPAPGLWECYVYGPESSPDPTTYRTELNQPII